MSNLRDWLTSCGFDWEAGTIIYHDTENRDSPGWCSVGEVVSRERISNDHPVLDEEFDNGHGGPECPRIVAFDSEAVYFPAQYDGATWLERLAVRPEAYLEGGSMTPYPGG